MHKNFPDAQKLSGQQCYPATQVFGPLDGDNDGDDESGDDDEEDEDYDVYDDDAEMCVVFMLINQIILVSMKWNPEIYLSFI